MDRIKVCLSVIVLIHFFSDDDDEYWMQLQVEPQVPFPLHVGVKGPVVFSNLHIRNLKERHNTLFTYEVWSSEHASGTRKRERERDTLSNIS